MTYNLVTSLTLALLEIPEVSLSMLGTPASFPLPHSQQSVNWLNWSTVILCLFIGVEDYFVTSNPLFKGLNLESLGYLAGTYFVTGILDLSGIVCFVKCHVLISGWSLGIKES